MRGDHSFRNRYFKDFSRKIVVDPQSMKTRVEYVYEGTYYTMEDSKNLWLLRKAAYTLLFLLETGAYLLSMAQRTLSNYLMPVTLIQAIGIFLLMGSGMSLFCRITSSQRMTDWEYRMAVTSMREFSGLFGGIMTMLLIGEVAYLVANGSLLAEGEPITLLLQAFAAGVGLFLAGCVQREHCRTDISQDLPKGIDITNDFASF
ncbi:MAG: hypothetical protein LUD12_08825 [Lachnospiraceae bacterium]|nr:hypothetical protein [Lachnospiraceae bacterium]